MLIRFIYMYLVGFVSISVEGFFVERFINKCLVENIFLWNIKNEKSTFLRARIEARDFKKIKKIARKTNCRVKIESKKGLPFFIFNYRKRKIFVIIFLLIFVTIFVLTKFIWNVDIIGTDKINKNEIEALLRSEGIYSGNLKKKINLDTAIAKIRLKRKDIAWIGIKIVGTNAIVQIAETIDKPEIVDETVPCNIVSKKNAVISNLIVKNGTAKVNIGDSVKQGDILVEGVMEGKYTGIRQVHADAIITGKITIEKTKKESLIQQFDEETGKREKKIEINLNNFKIILPKGVSKLKKYDTIRTNKRLRIFSNFYLPVSITKIELIEKEVKYKTYSQEELIDKMVNELTEEIVKENNLYDKNIEKNIETNVENGMVEVKVTGIVQEEIGTKENL